MKLSTLLLALATCIGASAQTFNHYTTTEGAPWKQSRITLSRQAAVTPLIEVETDAQGHEFKAWGTCFNELDLDALRLLSEEMQQEVMHGLFAPDGDLHFTRGRLTMNANDYSRAWYSCDTVSGDFQLRYFNIEHDKKNVIQLIRMAQKYQPELTFWMSPWSPPAWMKINQDYPVMSSRWNKQAKEKDYLLFEGIGEVDEDEVKMAGQQQGKFPRRLAVQDYMIQDPRYLQAYADMFCRFVELYGEEGIPIDMVMYQNEAYSYTAYPGCAWTADGTIRFNRDYLVPTMQRRHPEVKVYIGTFNTNRMDYVKKIVDNLHDHVDGIGLQWEGRDNIDSLRALYPELSLIQSESECGNGRMDWRAGEHTFNLMCDYIGRGCEEYYIWNFILCDNGRSPWDWRQNALIQVDSHTHQHHLTAEYYAVKHFAHLVAPGSQMLRYSPRVEGEGVPVIVFRRPDGKLVVITGNLTEEVRTLSVKLGKKYLNATLPPHSLHTFAER